MVNDPMFVVGRMEKNTLENGTTEINMVMVSMNCQMDRKWKENGKTAIKSNG